MELVVLAFGPFVLIFGGCALMFALWQQRGKLRVIRGYGLWSAGVATARVLVLVGIFAALAVMTQGFAPLAWLAANIVLVMAIRRYRDSERQSLMWLLTVAAERGIRLDTAARAFAAEREGATGIRARNLAEYLEAGIPLALALKRSRHSLPTTAVLAADMGQGTDNLGEALRRATDQIDTEEATLPPILEAVFYFVFVVLFGTGMCTFMMLSIVPVMARMFEEFGLKLPRVTQALIASAHFLLATGAIFPLLGLLLLVMALGVMHYAGFSLRFVPGIRRLWWRSDCALVMRWLAVAVRQDRSIAETIRLLAGYFPQPSIRSRLEKVSLQIEHGASWCESLQRANLIRHAECVVFNSAERAGNLAWALDEMASSSIRRSTYRLRACMSVAFPTVVVAMSLGVLFLAMGLLMPLFSLIQGLS